MENICFELRYLPDTRRLATDHSLLLLCDLSHSHADAVDVAIVSGLWEPPSGGRSTSGSAGAHLCSLLGSQSFHPEDLPDHSLVQEAATAIVSSLSGRRNSTVMLAIVEVKVETQAPPPPSAGEWAFTKASQEGPGHGCPWV